jgi:hypothetical protein
LYKSGICTVKFPYEPSALLCYGDEGNVISSGLLRPMTGVPMNRVFHRVGLPSLEAAEQFISATPANWPADVAEDLREWISNFTWICIDGHGISRCRF